MRLEEAFQSINVATAGAEHRHGRPGWVQVDCPWCGPGSNKFHLGISVYTGTANCWRCGKHRLWDVLEYYAGTKKRAYEINEKLRFDFSQLPGNDDDEAERTLKVPKGLGPMQAVHRRYLSEKRRLDVDAVERKWDLEGIGVHPSLSWRIYFPIKLHNRTVSWVTRSVVDGRADKYKTAKPEESLVNPKNLLFGIDFCYTAVIIHEGPLDVLTTGPGATALLGLNYSYSQVLQLSQFAKRVICLDAQPSAQVVARKLCEDLSVFPGETFNVVLETGKDVNEAEPWEVQQLRKEVFGVRRA